MMTDTELTALGFEPDAHPDEARTLTVLTGHGLRLVFPIALQLTPRDLIAAAVMQAGADAVQTHQKTLRAFLGFDIADHGSVRVVR